MKCRASRPRAFFTIFASSAVSAGLAACARPTSGNGPGGPGGELANDNPSSVSASSSPSKISATEPGANLAAQTSGTEDAEAAGDGRARARRCNDAGQCTCFNIASIGRPGDTGSSVDGVKDSTTEFIDWLNTESSASVDLYETKPTLTPAFLANYDVIVLQWLSDSNNGGPYWQFSQSEVSALGDWVKAGGGLVTLSGFEPNAGEIGPLNTLLSFTDMSYAADDVLGQCAGALPCYCWGNTVPVGPWNAGPIGDNIEQVGAYHGRSINSGSATIDASGTGTNGNALVYAAHEDVGAGHVFSWADEWVTYTSQWLGVPASDAGNDMYTTPGNACYQQSAAQVFQVPQFWYNVISYAAEATTCPFTISNPTIIAR